jgi:hypothetical protein
MPENSANSSQSREIPIGKPFMQMVASAGSYQRRLSRYFRHLHSSEPERTASRMNPNAIVTVAGHDA